MKIVNVNDKDHQSMCILLAHLLSPGELKRRTPDGMCLPIRKTLTCTCNVEIFNEP